MLKQKFTLISLVLLVLVLAACQAAPAANTVQPTQPLMDTPIVSTLPVLPTPTTAIPPTPTVPDPAYAQQAAISALSVDKGIPIDSIQLVSTEAVEWSESCLGVVFPGVSCLQGVVPGYKIMLSAYGSTYEYHTDLEGSNVLMVPATFVRIAVRMLDGSVKIVPIDKADTQVEIKPAAQGFLPVGGTARGVVYTQNNASASSVFATDAGGTHTLDFIQKPNYGLSVWPGDASSGPLLAWGTFYNIDTKLTELFVSAPDGSELETLVSEKIEAMPLYSLIAQRFSADGKTLYFSKEPFGIGGYILYGGASSLFSIDLARKRVTEIIPFDPQATQSTFICLDSLSPDYTLVADHCTPGVITVLNLDTRHAVTILPPAVVKDKSILGSARFSPDSSRLAFAGAKGDPDGEQGWLAVSDGLGSSSTLIITSDVGKYFVVLGWLNDSTLLVQTNTVNCDIAECPSEVWTVAVDGSAQNKVTDGTFVTFVDEYKP